MKYTCYWCGAPATSTEHVPPKNLFPKGHRKNLITVPACELHNETFSKLDERFRLVVLAGNEDDFSEKVLQDKVIRGLYREGHQGLLNDLLKNSFPATLNGEKTLGFKISKADAELYFEKIVRGLYFHHYQEIFGGEIRTVCTNLPREGLDMKQVISLFESFKRDMTEGKSENPEVFRYWHGNIESGAHYAFAMIMRFYDETTCFSFGLPKNEIVEPGGVVNASASRD